MEYNLWCSMVSLTVLRPDRRCVNEAEPQGFGRSVRRFRYFPCAPADTACTCSQCQPQGSAGMRAGPQAYAHVYACVRSANRRVRSVWVMLKQHVRSFFSSLFAELAGVRSAIRRVSSVWVMLKQRVRSGRRISQYPALPINLCPQWSAVIFSRDFFQKV